MGKAFSEIDLIKDPENLSNFKKWDSIKKSRGETRYRSKHIKNFYVRQSSDNTYFLYSNSKKGQFRNISLLKITSSAYLVIRRLKEEIESNQIEWAKL